MIILQTVHVHMFAAQEIHVLGEVEKYLVLDKPLV